MALTTIEYGSLANSATLNNNFNYLDGRITTTANSVASLNSQISSVNTNLTTNKANKDLSNITGISNISSYLDAAYAKKDLSNTTISSAPYLKTIYISGSSGYNIWSNGFCEQWGYGAYGTITLIKTYTDTNYSVMVSPRYVYVDDNWDIGIKGGYASTTNTFILSTGRDNGNISTQYAYWKTSGYLAEGQY